MKFIYFWQKIFFDTFSKLVQLRFFMKQSDFFWYTIVSKKLKLKIK